MYWRVPVHAFVDESKVGGLLVCVAVASPGALASARSALRGLLLPGQRRPHFNHERPARRQRILTTICQQTGVSVDVYDARSFGAREELKPREASLRAIVADLAAERASRLIIERDDSVAAHDKRVLYDAVRAVGVADDLMYHLLSPQEEPLLWVADAAAWSWVKGGDWRTRVGPVVRNVRTIQAP